MMKMCLRLRGMLQAAREKKLGRSTIFQPKYLSVPPALPPEHVAGKKYPESPRKALQGK